MFEAHTSVTMPKPEQITVGKISEIIPQELYLLVTCETIVDGIRYLTKLRVGLTNYPIEIGDTLSWSTFYGGSMPNIIWWVSKNRELPERLWLIGVESQRGSAYEV